MTLENSLIFKKFGNLRRDAFSNSESLGWDFGAWAVSHVHSEPVTVTLTGQWS